MSNSVITVQAIDSTVRRVVMNDMNTYGGIPSLYTFTTLAEGAPIGLTTRQLNVGHFNQGARGPGGNTDVTHMKASGTISTRTKAVPPITSNGTFVFINGEVTTTMSMGGFGSSGDGTFAAFDGKPAARCYFDNYVRVKHPYTSNPSPGKPVGFLLSATGSWRQRYDGTRVWVQGTGIQSYSYAPGGTISFVALRCTALSVLNKVGGRVISASGTIELWQVTIDVVAKTYVAVNTYRVKPLVGGAVSYGPDKLLGTVTKDFPTWDPGLNVYRFHAKYSNPNSTTPFFDALVVDAASFARKPRSRGGVAMAALESYRAINSNNIENIAQLREVSRLLPLDAAVNLFEASSRGLVKGAPYLSKAVSQLYLWYRYVFKTSFRDFRQWRSLIEKTQSVFEKCDQPRHLRGQIIYTEEYAGHTFEIRETERITVAPYVNEKLLKALYIGMEPGLGQAWDLIPFSFVMDWFIPVAGTLRAIDWFAYQSLLGIKYRVKGHKVSCTLTWPDYDGEVELSWYTRVVTSSWPDFVERVPLPRSVPISNWAYAAAALVISR